MKLPEPKGDVHITWTGNGSADLDQVFTAPVFFDDNTLLGSVVDVDDGNGGWISSAFDHWVIDWIEYDSSGNFQGALCSRRDQWCTFPGTSVVSATMTIGSPVAASIKGKFRGYGYSPQCPCNQCNNIVDTWGSYGLTINWGVLGSLGNYGGTYWDMLKYMGGIQLGPQGFTGPIGPGASWGGSHRIAKQNLSQSDITALGTGGLDSGTSYFSVYLNLEKLARAIDNTQMDLGAAAAYREQAYRDAGFVTALSQSSSCCQEKIIDVALPPPDSGIDAPKCHPCDKDAFPNLNTTPQNQGPYSVFDCASPSGITADGSTSMGDYISSFTTCGPDLSDWADGGLIGLSIACDGYDPRGTIAKFNLTIDGNACSYNATTLDPDGNFDTCPCSQEVPVAGTSIEFAGLSYCDPYPEPDCVVCVEDTY